MSIITRYTCWHQYTNRRYENEGSRIDYIFVDDNLKTFVTSNGTGKLRCGGYNCNHEGSLTEEAAFSACTANGAYQPASFNGEGIGSATQRVLDTQFGEPHTG